MDGSLAGKTLLVEHNCGNIILNAMNFSSILHLDGSVGLQFPPRAGDLRIRKTTFNVDIKAAVPLLDDAVSKS